jgi:hypothetical protein
MNIDLAIVIQTCDKYDIFWNAWFKSFCEYWDFELPYKIYFCNEVSELPFKHDKITQLKTGINEFSDRLLFILNNIPEEYLFYIQEDIWLIKSINIAKYYSDFVKYNFDSLRIPRDYNRFYKLIQHIEGDYIQLDNVFSGFLVSHHPSFWKKSFFIKCMCKGENPWMNETLATERIRKINPRIFTIIKTVKWYFEVSKCGYLKKCGVDVLRKYKIFNEFPIGRIDK